MAPKLALVTGSSSGIGLEFARILARAGYDLGLIARSGEKLQALASELRANFGVAAHALAVDLSARDAVQHVLARFPACDVLVNNAGFANNGPFAQLQVERIDEEIALDVATLTQLARAYLPGMLVRRDGKILNVASTAAFLPGPYMAVYYACKAYVLSFSEALAAEVRGSGVTVTALCPGPTATSFQQRAGVRETLLFRLGTANAARVAQAGFDGMVAGRTVVVPGLLNKLVAISPRFSPRAMLVWVSAKLIERKQSRSNSTP